MILWNRNDYQSVTALSTRYICSGVILSAKCLACFNTSVHGRCDRMGMASKDDIPGISRTSCHCLLVIFFEFNATQSTQMNKCVGSWSYATPTLRTFVRDNGKVFRWYQQAKFSTKHWYPQSRKMCTWRDLLCCCWQWRASKLSQLDLLRRLACHWNAYQSRSTVGGLPTFCRATYMRNPIPHPQTDSEKNVTLYRMNNPLSYDRYIPNKIVKHKWGCKYTW